MEDYQAIIEKSKEMLVVIDFTATWCGPCQKIAPKFSELAKTYAGSAILVKIDVDKNQYASRAAGITCMPTFQFYKGGKKVDEM